MSTIVYPIINGRIGRPTAPHDLEITFHRAPGEPNEPEDIQKLLRAGKIRSRLWTHNPITYDMWHFVLDIAQKPAAYAAAGATLLGMLKVWTDHAKGRRIEIRRGKVTIKAPSLSVLKKTLKALQEYDDIQLTSQRAKTKRGASAGRKRPALTSRAKRPRKKR